MLLVQTLVNHLWQDTPIATLLKIALEDAQLEMGTTWRLTPKPSWKLDQWFTTESWIKQCLEFLWEFDIHIEPLGTQLLPLRERDRALMDCFTIHTQDTTTLRQLNRCRTAKQALWLSDVFSAEGSNIAPAAWNKQPMPSHFSWPEKHHVTPQDWAIWKRALRSIQHMFILGP